MEHHSNIVPWQMLCERDGRAAARRRRSTTRRAAARRVRAAARPAHEARRDRRTCRTRSARSTRSRDIVRLAHAAGAPVLLDGVQAAYSHAGRRAGARLRLLRRSPATRFYGPTGIGVLYGKAEHARGDAAVHGRRRHDQLGHLREEHLERAAVQVRGGHAGHRRRGRPARGARLHRRRRLRRDRARTSASCCATRTERAGGDAGRAPDRHGAATRRASCRS